MIGQGHLTARRRRGASRFVRIVHHGDAVSCEVIGVEHRRPVRRQVSLSTATALAVSGAPVVVRRCSCAEGQTAADPAAVTAVR